MAPNNAFVFISILVIVVLFVADFLLGFAIDIDDFLTYGAAIFLVLSNYFTLFGISQPDK